MGLWRCTRTLDRLMTSSDDTIPRASNELRLIYQPDPQDPKLDYGDLQFLPCDLPRTGISR